jgi:tryptophan-rich sensory protein
MNNTFEWYQQLIKPFWAPPAWAFGPVWTFLYVVIAISFGKVFWLAFKKKIPIEVTIPFVLNIFFNFMFTPIQFGLQNNPLALLDILFVWGTLAWAMIAIYPHKKWITYAQVPYMLWVSIATILQISITLLNG